MKIAIAGAFGFIGQHLIREILDHTDDEIVAFSRTARQADDPRIQCEAVDLYSLKDANQGLRGCDVAIYLVHSMSKSARLSQGSFSDFDYILADNFGRAAKSNGIRHIIYVGGMIPETEALSPHLESRLEVEEVLRSHGIPVTALRCGLVIGPNGSSFSMIVRLTERLPFMILPKWMRTLSNPICVWDLASIIVKCIQNPPEKNRIFDSGMDQAVSYKDVVVATAKVIGRSPTMIDVPYVSPHLSKLWVRLVSGAPKALVYPLIDSVQHAMLKNSKNGLPSSWGIVPRSLLESIEATFKIPFTFKMPKLLTSIKNLSEVRSVQRMPIPPGQSARWVASSYTGWLPRYLKPFLKIVSTENGCEYRVRMLSILLLSLKLDLKVSQDDRQLFRVGKGLLVASGNQGRFEFRESHDGKFVIAALHNFRPALPWLLYRWTQAVLHKMVMGGFGRYLMVRK